MRRRVEIETEMPILVLGVAGQAALCYWTFRHPRSFWPLMTLGLSASGLPGLCRLRQHPQVVQAGWLAVGATAGLAGYGITASGAALLCRLTSGRRWLAQFHRCTGRLTPPLAALLVLPAAAGEELFWRDTLLGRLLRGGSQPSRGLWLRSTLLYGAVQAGSLQPLPPLGGLLLGAGAGWIRLRSGSVWPAVLGHLVYTELCLVRPGLPGAPEGPLPR
jgi:membrane protease YdiL (CAAX protease family)